MDAVGIKQVAVHILRPAGLARAISSAGGVALNEVDENFQLRKKPGTYVAGEMLDWEAPTGGYLLQASLATGVAAARGLLRSM
jgi:predicted flavoprotein YhiN